METSIQIKANVLRLHLKRKGSEMRLLHTTSYWPCSWPSLFSPFFCLFSKFIPGKLLDLDGDRFLVVLSYQTKGWNRVIEGRPWFHCHNYNAIGWLLWSLVCQAIGKVQELHSSNSQNCTQFWVLWKLLNYTNATIVNFRICKFHLPFFFKATWTVPIRAFVWQGICLCICIMTRLIQKEMPCSLWLRHLQIMWERIWYKSLQNGQSEMDLALHTLASRTGEA